MTGNTHGEGAAHDGTREVDASQLTPEQRKGHEESQAAIHELEQQVAQAEQAEGKPAPSQADADETAATGL